jgi:hypothetical protein
MWLLRRSRFEVQRYWLNLVGFGLIFLPQPFLYGGSRHGVEQWAVSFAWTVFGVLVVWASYLPLSRRPRERQDSG